MLTRELANVSITLTPSIATPVYGQPETFTAAFTPEPGAPQATGVVTFTAPTSGPSATFPAGSTTTLNLVGKGKVTPRANGVVGTYTVTATARGAANVVFTLKNVDATTVTLSSSVNSSNLGQAVTFTATVKPSTAGSGAPTGTVTFFDGAATLGTATLDTTGRARFTTSGFALAAGCGMTAHPIGSARAPAPESSGRTRAARRTAS